VTDNRKGLGSAGEEEAARLLKKNGYKILERNYRSRFGEIDIVAREGETMVFVEVKTRTGENFGSPKEALDKRKRRHITRASMDYLARAGSGSERPVRFDVVTVTVELKDGSLSTELIKNAFEAQD
jgi:putative endonuclease